MKRMYDPSTGRFISVDPSPDVAGQESLSTYQYGYNNPLRYPDPNGDCPNCVTGAIGAGIGGLIGGGIEAGKQLYQHGEIKDWKAVGGAALQGGITGGAAGFTGGASLLSTAGVAGGANVVGGYVNRTVIQGKETTITNLVTDATVGAVFGAGGKFLGDKASQILTKNSLLKELTSNGVKHSADDILGIGKNSAGKVIFLEKGNTNAGLEHIVANHGKEFTQAGISKKNISKFIMQAVLKGKEVGMQGTRPIYETTYKGVTQRVAVTVGNNGFVVGANMVSK